MKKLLAAVALGAMLVIGGVAHATPPNPDHKVTLCHRTGSASNPYIVITTDIASDGLVKGGHNNHEQVGNGLGGDIIPAYSYTFIHGPRTGETFEYPGKNLDTVISGTTGAAILEAGCVVPTSTPTPTETPSPTETPTPTDSPKPLTCHDTGTCHSRDFPPTRHPHGKPGAPQKTAFTGTDVSKPLAAGLGLLGIGGTLLWLRRRYA